MQSALLVCQSNHSQVWKVEPLPKGEQHPANVSFNHGEQRFRLLCSLWHSYRYQRQRIFRPCHAYLLIPFETRWKSWRSWCHRFSLSESHPTLCLTEGYCRRWFLTNCQSQRGSDARSGNSLNDEEIWARIDSKTSRPSTNRRQLWSVLLSKGLFR